MKHPKNCPFCNCRVSILADDMVEHPLEPSCCLMGKLFKFDSWNKREVEKENLFFLLAEAEKFEEDIDADQNDEGRMVSNIRYHITISDNTLAELIDSAGIKRNYTSETLLELLNREYAKSMETKP